MADLSRYLDAKAVRGFQRVGDFLIPGRHDLPSFSQSGLLKDADRMLAFLPSDDRKGLVDLGRALAWMPRWAFVCLFWLTARAARFPTPVASILRQVELGIKGLVFGVYYSDPGVRAKLGWDAAIRSEVKP